MRPGAAAREAAKKSDHIQGKHQSSRRSGGADEMEGDMGIEVLAVAAAALAAIWIIVLWGSRYFGPQ